METAPQNTVFQWLTLVEQLDGIERGLQETTCAICCTLWRAGKIFLPFDNDVHKMCGSTA